MINAKLASVLLATGVCVIAGTGTKQVERTHSDKHPTVRVYESLAGDDALAKGNTTSDIANTICSVKKSDG